MTAVLEGSSVSVKTMSARIKDITGQRFGMLVAEEYAGSEGGKAWWWCRCDCGTTLIQLGTLLRYGAVRSCSCQQTVAMRAARFKNGGKRSEDPELRRFCEAWSGMKARCRNPKHKDFKYYGGIGVDVCARWDSFDNFKADMWPRPEGKTLDRIDGTKGYEPGNCRWATAIEQRHNRRIA